MQQSESLLRPPLPSLLRFAECLRHHNSSRSHPNMAADVTVSNRLRLLASDLDVSPDLFNRLARLDVLNDWELSKFLEEFKYRRLNVSFKDSERELLIAGKDVEEMAVFDDFMLDVWKKYYIEEDVAQIGIFQGTFTLPTEVSAMLWMKCWIFVHENFHYGEKYHLLIRLGVCWMDLFMTCSWTLKTPESNPIFKEIREKSANTSCIRVKKVKCSKQHVSVGPRLIIIRRDTMNNFFSKATDSRETTAGTAILFRIYFRTINTYYFRPKYKIWSWSPTHTKQ